MNGALEWLTTEIGLTVGSTIFSMSTGIVGFLMGLNARSPKLHGEGGGDTAMRIPGLHTRASFINVRNLHTVWGLRIGREPARIIAASLWDPKDRGTVGNGLVWATDGQEFSREKTIPSGERAQLYLFAKDKDADDYFVFSAEGVGGPLHRGVRFSDSQRDFVVILQDQFERECRLAIVVRNHPHSITVGTKYTLRDRLRVVGTGLRMIKAGLTRRS